MILYVNADHPRGAPVARVRVPAFAKPTLEAAAKIPPRRLEALAESLDSCPSSRSELVDLISSPLVDPDFPSSAFLTEVLAIMGFMNSHNGELDEVSLSVAESTVLELSTSQRKRLNEVLIIVMSSKAILTMGKAIELSRAFDQRLHTARIVSDARPIFSEADADPVGFFIGHGLKLEYFEQNQTKAVTLNLDRETMAALRDALDRAESKEAALISFLRGKNCHVFDVSRGENE